MLLNSPLYSGTEKIPECCFGKSGVNWSATKKKSKKINILMKQNCIIKEGVKDGHKELLQQTPSNFLWMGLSTEMRLACLSFPVFLTSALSMEYLAIGNKIG